MKKIILSLLFLVSLSAHSQDNALTVIGNNNAVPSQLSFTELQSIFLGNKSEWSNGDKVIIALMKLTTVTGKATCEKLYNMSPDQVTKHWLSVSIKGSVDAPVFFNSAAELRSFVSATRGAIAVMSEPVTVPNSKIVLVDGKKTF